MCECLKPLQTFRRSFGKSWPPFSPSKLLMNCTQDILFPMFWKRKRQMDHKFTVSWCADLFHSSCALTTLTNYTVGSNRVNILCKNNFAAPENHFYYYIYGWISIFIPECKSSPHPLRVENSSENKIHPKNTVVLSSQRLHFCTLHVKIQYRYFTIKSIITYNSLRVRSYFL